MDKETKVTATYDKDTRRMHRYIVEANDKGITGSIYINKELAEIPEAITITLKERSD